MNLQLHHVISDITGLTGLAIIDAILAGERDPATLAALRNRRIHASVETVTKSLVGDYRPEHVFTLRQSLGAYRYYQQLVAESDVEIERHLTAIPDAQPVVTARPASVTRRKARGNEPRFDLRTHLHRIFGGPDDHSWNRCAHGAYAAHRGRSGALEVSRARRLSLVVGALPRQPDQWREGAERQNSAGQEPCGLALRMSAQAVQGSHSAPRWLPSADAGQARRPPWRSPRPRTNFPGSSYHLIASGQRYDESVFLKHEASHRARVQKRLQAQAAALGLGSSQQPLFLRRSARPAKVVDAAQAARDAAVNRGRVRLNVWISVSSSTLSTTAFSAGWRYKPTTVSIRGDPTTEEQQRWT